MKKYFLLFALCISLGILSLTWARAQDENEPPEEAAMSPLSATVQKAAVMRPVDPATYLNGLAPQYLANNHGVGVAIGFIRNGKPSTFYYGEVAKGSGTKPDGSTIFMIGSISKTFTALLLALHSANGPMHLSDPLQNYAPAGVTVPNYNGVPITLESLATHTSALPRKPPQIPNPGQFTIPQLWNSLSQVTLNYPPGSKYLYSNYGFSLLGQAIAKAMGKTWHALVEQEIDAPLGMTDTKTDLSSAELPRRAQGYGKNGNQAPYSMPGFPSGNPAGGLYSTMNDMMKYLSFNMGGMNTSLNSVRSALFTPLHQAGGPNAQVGLAWQMNSLAGTQRRVLWKNGSVAGFMSYIGFTEDGADGVVVLLNFLPTTDGVNSLGTEILQYLVEAPALASPAHSQPVSGTPHP